MDHDRDREDDDGAPETDPGRIAAEACDVLRTVARWKAGPGLWQRIETIVDRLSAAVADEDHAALDEAVADLESSSPERVIKVGESEGKPAPRPVLERVNHLIHQLAPAEASPPRSAKTDGSADRTDAES